MRRNYSQVTSPGYAVAAQYANHPSQTVVCWSNKLNSRALTREKAELVSVRFMCV